MSGSSSNIRPEAGPSDPEVRVDPPVREGTALRALLRMVTMDKTVMQAVPLDLTLALTAEVKNQCAMLEEQNALLRDIKAQKDEQLQIDRRRDVQVQRSGSTPVIEEVGAALQAESLESNLRSILGGKKILIDAGFGGSKPGAVANGLVGKGLTLATAMLVYDFLYKEGYRVALTRSTDVLVPLNERSALANRKGADLFVCIHYNGAIPTGHGTEVFVYPNEKEGEAGKCAETVLDSVVAKTGFRNRGVKTWDFHVLRETDMAAIMVLPGFLTSSTDSNKLRERNTIVDIAAAIAEGVDNHFTYFF
ncbi:hypothetical protein BSKO_01098 [Bryopsis sp. KO-2023]|nr:hypothetical protein BSKO_01098 [Bryopsis sp. KO-2023]